MCAVNITLAHGVVTAHHAAHRHQPFPHFTAILAVTIPVVMEAVLLVAMDGVRPRERRSVQVMVLLATQMTADKGAP